VSGKKRLGYAGAAILLPSGNGERKLSGFAAFIRRFSSSPLKDLERATRIFREKQAGFPTGVEGGRHFP
jgi:hypothetical protein